MSISNQSISPLAKSFLKEQNVPQTEFNIKTVRIQIANQLLNGINSSILQSALSSNLSGMLEDLLPGRARKNERYQLTALAKENPQRLVDAWKKKLDTSKRKISSPSISGLFEAVWPERIHGSVNKDSNLVDSEIILKEIHVIESSLSRLKKLLDN